MKRNYLPFVALAALGSTPAFAAPYEGWVYNGLTGWASASQDNVVGTTESFNQTAYGSNSSIGYRWGTVGVEGGYARFGSLNDTANDGVDEFKVETDLSGWTLGANFNGPLNERWTVQGRVGAFFWDADVKLNINGVQAFKGSDSSTDWYAGASIDYIWGAKKRASIGLGWTYYSTGDVNVNVIGVSSEFRF